MDPIPKSGLHYCNKFSRIALNAYEDVLGKNGINAILNLAGLSNLIGNYPPDNLDKEFDFADFSAFHGALEEMYGERGGRALALRAGRATFEAALKNYGALAGVGDITFQILPLQAKLKVGMPGMAKVFSTLTDQQSTWEDKGDHSLWTIHKCPICWGRKTTKPGCHISTGLLEASVAWVSGGVAQFTITQVTAKSCGDPTCDFVIKKAS